MDINEPISRLINTLTEIIGEKHGIKIKADFKDREKISYKGRDLNEKRDEDSESGVLHSRKHA